MSRRHPTQVAQDEELRRAKRLQFLERFYDAWCKGAPDSDLRAMADAEGDADNET